MMANQQIYATPALTDRIEGKLMNPFVNVTEIIPFTAPDGARVQQIAGRSEGMTSHSLAIISHPAGTESTDHHHTVADEIYLVWSGRGACAWTGRRGPWVRAMR